VHTGTGPCSRRTAASKQILRNLPDTYLIVCRLIQGTADLDLNFFSAGSICTIVTTCLQHALFGST